MVMFLGHVNDMQSTAQQLAGMVRRGVLKPDSYLDSLSAPDGRYARDRADRGPPPPQAVRAGTAPMAVPPILDCYAGQEESLLFLSTSRPSRKRRRSGARTIARRFLPQQGGRPSRPGSDRCFRRTSAVDAYGLLKTMAIQMPWAAGSWQTSSTACSVSVLPSCRSGCRLRCGRSL